MIDHERMKELAREEDVAGDDTTDDELKAHLIAQHDSEYFGVGEPDTETDDDIYERASSQEGWSVLTKKGGQVR